MNLQEFIEKTGITVNKLAARCGVSYHHIRHILKNKNPSLTTAIAISEYTEGLVPVEEMVPKKLSDDICNKKDEHKEEAMD